MMTIDPRHGNAFYYDLEAPPFDDVSFYVQQISREAAVLELGCGTGRVLIPLAQHVQTITGVDYSAEMIAVCQKKLAMHPPTRCSVHLQVGDITALNLGRAFDVIIAPYRVFQALASDDAVEGFFHTVSRHLNAHGVCILNVFFPRRDKATLQHTWCQPNEVLQWEKTLDDGTRVVHTEEYKIIDREKMILYPKLIYRRYRDAQLFEEFIQPIAMRVYYPEEFTSLVKAHGFSISERWGGYAGEVYGVGPELVLKFQKQQ